MARITCRYFVNAVGVTKKDSESVEVADGLTVEQFLEHLLARYGPDFEALAYATGSLEGKPFKKPDIYLNKKRLQWARDFPAGLQTMLRDGDELWFGLIFSGG